MMDRRSFLRLLGGAASVTAAGLVLPYEPQRVYSFLTNNPLAAPLLAPRSFLVLERFPLPVAPLAEGVVLYGHEALTTVRVTALVDQWGNWYDLQGVPSEKSPWWRRHGYPLDLKARPPMTDLRTRSDAPETDTPA